jgi:geranylgeranyl diphosphate synthase type II
MLNEAAKMFDYNSESVIPFCCALEMIHSYSLIHDDLPALDNSDYRRGQLSAHKMYGEELAILSGDGLLNYAYEIMLKRAIEDPNESKKYILAMNEIASAAGVNGMVFGQVLDSNSPYAKNQSIQNIRKTIYLKTSKLFIGALKCGAILGNASEHDLIILEKYGECFGEAFQIYDDVLDEIGNFDNVGKDLRKDKENNKVTYVSTYGLDIAIERVDELFSMSKEIISELDNSSFFVDLIDYVSERKS